MTPSEFLTMLWGNPPPGPVLIWTLPGRKSTWYSRFNNIDQDLRHRQNQEIYTGVGIPRKDLKLTSFTRAKTPDIAALAGLWADIDIAHPLHKKSNLPPNVEEAIDCLKELPMEPSIIIHSGHGIQAWWLFEQPWQFQEPDDNYNAQTLTHWWQNEIAQCFGKRHYTVDSVFDLARVMRLPGTINRKDPEDPKEVTTIRVGEHRCDPQELLRQIPPQFTAQITPPKTADGRPIPGGITLRLNPNAEPPNRKFIALIANDTKFRNTWNNKRGDFKDQSPSSYDMSLASTAARAGWEDQEIADLLIAFRRQHGFDLKLRENYYSQTIRNARAPIEHLEARQNLMEASESQPEDLREVLYENLSTLFGIRIREITKFVQDPPEYYLSTDKGDITLGPINSITNRTTFINLVAAATGVMINKDKTGNWTETVQSILDSVVEKSIGNASHPATQITEWLTGYFAERPPAEIPKETHAASDRPFIADGRISIYLNDLTNWIAKRQDKSVNPRQISKWLRMIHAEPRTISIKIKGNPTTRHTWQLSESYRINTDQEQPQ